MFFILPVKVFPCSLGLIYSSQPNRSWEWVPPVAHLFKGVSVQIHAAGMPAVPLERSLGAGEPPRSPPGGNISGRASPTASFWGLLGGCFASLLHLHPLPLCYGVRSQRCWSLCLTTSCVSCSRAGDAGFQLAVRPGEQRSALHHQQSQGTWSRPALWGDSGTPEPC